MSQSYYQLGKIQMCEELESKVYSISRVAILLPARKNSNGMRTEKGLHQSQTTSQSYYQLGKIQMLYIVYNKLDEEIIQSQSYYQLGKIQIKSYFLYSSGWYIFKSQSYYQLGKIQIYFY